MTSGQPTTLLLAAHSLFHGALDMLQTHQAEPRQRWGSGDPPHPAGAGNLPRQSRHIICNNWGALLSVLQAIWCLTQPFNSIG